MLAHSCHPKGLLDSAGLVDSDVLARSCLPKDLLDSAGLVDSDVLAHSCLPKGLLDFAALVQSRVLRCCPIPKKNLKRHCILLDLAALVPPQMLDSKPKVNSAALVVHLR